MASPDRPQPRDTQRTEVRRRASDAPLDRVPPHNLEAEVGLLSSCIIDGGRDTLTLCVDNKLKPESFFKPAHQMVYRAMIQLYEEGIPVDEIVLKDRMQKNGELEDAGGIATITDISSAVDTSLGATYWMDIVKEKDLMRRLIRAATQTVESCFRQTESIDQFLEQVEQNIFKISQDRVVESAKHIREPIDHAVQQIQLLINNKVSSFGVRTGLTELDRLTLGFHPGEMIVLAARPSVGKTSLAMNFAEAAVCPPPSIHTDPAAAMVFSLEMTADQLALRLLTGRSRVDSKRVRDGILNSDEQSALATSARELKNAPLYIDDSGGISILEVRAKARRLAARLPDSGGLKFVVVDYLQLIHGTDSRVPREQQISEISRGLKAMAKELNVPVLVLSQLNRESEKEKREPRLSDLRESGSIEQDADVVFILHRPIQKDEGDSEPEGRNRYLPGDVERINLIIAKQRNGPVGEVPLTFRRQYTRFENYSA